MQKTLKITETLAYGYSYESTQRELSNEYQDSVKMVFEVFFAFFCLGKKVSSALEGLRYTVEPVYIEHSREMKKCSIYAGVQCIQVLSDWRSGEIETKSRVIRET